MLDNSFELVTKQNYFRTEDTHCRIETVGKSVAELVDTLDVSETVLRDIDVVISKGDAQEVVPRELWARVKPASGSHVLICPRVQGPAAAAIISALLPTAATSIAGALFTAGTLAFKVAVVAITVVGSLAVNALIPPPSAPNSITEDDPNFSITGSSNAENRYGIYPTVIGRHKIFPPKTARGYTEGTGENIYYRGRFTFGYGPVALEDLRIGTTPVTDFEGIELEFLNVDQAETLARMPELAPFVKAWRTGDAKMTLYPNDIAEDAEQVRLTKDNAIVRRTRERAVSASVDVTFQGLVQFDSNNDKQTHSERVRFRYSVAGADAWVDAGTETYSGASTASLRFTKTIQFPTDGEYDIEVVRLTEDSDEAEIRDDAYLTAIRSVQSGDLPSHANIAEMAIRVKASDQLNGQLDTVNAIALQMAPVWNGNSWSGYQVVRHPAWQYARALMGPMLEDPVAESRLQLGDLLAWYNEEPHWTCDLVIDQPAQMAEILDVICAAGRARRTLRDLKYSIIRDGGAGPVIQQFTPRNSWDFKGTISFPKEIHGFLVRFVSEALDWQQDEMAVYFDGYNASNATKFETLDLRGVVLTKDESSGGNPWRLARYHGAQAKLRPETLTWQCDFENLRVTMGDKVRLVHDVPMIGVGFGRIKTLSEAGGFLQSIVLDDFISAVDGNYRVIVRRKNGDEVIFSASPPTSYDGIWTVNVGQDIAAGLASVGDLVSIEKMEQQSFEVLVKYIRHGPNLTATISGVPASPEVLKADQGAIPDYVPTITKVQPREKILPAKPIVKSALAHFLSNPARVVSRVEIEPYDRFEAELYHVAVTHPDGSLTRHGPFSDAAFDIPMSQFGIHLLEVRREDRSGQLSLAAQVEANWATSLTQPSNVDGFQIEVAGSHARLKWKRGEHFVSHYHIRHTNDPTAGWNGALDVQQEVFGTDAVVPALAGAYFIRAVSYFGSFSKVATMVTSETLNLAHHNVVETIQSDPAFEGDLAPGLSLEEQGLSLYGDQSIFDWDDLYEVENIYTHGGIPDVAYFELAQIVDLGHVYTSRVNADMRGFGFSTADSVFDWPDIYELADIYGDVGHLWRLGLQLATTRDDPDDPTAVWGDWQDFLVGDYAARGFKFRVRFESDDDHTSVVLQSLCIKVDMPDRDIKGRDIQCPAGGIQVTFDPPFMAVPTILTDAQNIPELARPERSNVTRSGFFQRFYDQNGNPIAASFDFVAAGYGRDMTTT